MIFDLNLEAIVANCRRKMMFFKLLLRELLIQFTVCYWATKINELSRILSRKTIGMILKLAFITISSTKNNY